MFWLVFKNTFQLFSFLAAVEVIIRPLMLFNKCLRQASFRLFEHFWVFSLTHMLLQHWMEMYPVSSCLYFRKSEAVCVWGQRHAIFVICSSVLAVWGMFCSIGLLWILLLLQRQSCSWYSHTHTHLKIKAPTNMILSPEQHAVVPSEFWVS